MNIGEATKQLRLSIDVFLSLLRAAAKLDKNRFQVTAIYVNTGTEQRKNYKFKCLALVRAVQASVHANHGGDD